MDTESERCRGCHAVRHGKHDPVCPVEYPKRHELWLIAESIYKIQEARVAIRQGKPCPDFTVNCWNFQRTEVVRCIQSDPARQGCAILEEMTRKEKQAKHARN